MSTPNHAFNQPNFLADQVLSAALPPLGDEGLEGFAEAPQSGESPKNSKLGAALQWTTRGFRVLPLKPNSKIAALDNWPERATSDPAKIREWWAENPDYNIGSCTGGGLVVVDIDNRDGKRGDESAERLCLAKTTLTTRTPTGGYHLYYSCESDCANATEILGPGSGLDIKSHRGYVVAPGSTIKGVPYIIENDGEILPVPEVLKPFLRSPGTRLRRLPDEPSDDSEAAKNQAIRYLQDVAPIAIEGQGGDTTTFAVAAHLTRDCGLSVDTSLELLMDHWNDRCEPPWAEDELRLKVENADKYGQREKGSGTVKKALADLTNLSLPEAGEREPRAANEALRSGGFDLTKGGSINPSYSNALVALSHSGLQFRHNVFVDRKTVNGDLPEYLGPELSDAVCRALRNLLLQRYRVDFGPINIREAAESLCESNRFDPICDYLDSVCWDGKPRIDQWLSRYLGADDTPLHRAFGRKVLCAMVRRARQPGCKFDHVLVLEGPQNAGKSQVCQILAGAPEYFSDERILHLDGRSQQEALKGRWVVEFGELAGMGKADVESLKNFITSTEDRGRAAYARFATNEPRRCVFIGTTNNSEYLFDPTGNRRFWPVKVGRIALEDLRHDRDQLFAEAVISAPDEDLFLSPEMYCEAEKAQKSRTLADPWIDALETLKGTLVEGEERIASETVFWALGIETAKATPQTAKRIADAMRALGWQGPKKLKVPVAAFGAETNHLTAKRGFFRPARTLQ